MDIRMCESEYLSGLRLTHCWTRSLQWKGIRHGSLFWSGSPFTVNQQCGSPSLHRGIVLQSLWYFRSLEGRESERGQQSCVSKNIRESGRFRRLMEVSRHIYSGKMWLMNIREAVQRQYADKMEQLCINAQSRVDDYQQKYMELLERIGNGEWVMFCFDSYLNLWEHRFCCVSVLHVRDSAARSV